MGQSADLPSAHAVSWLLRMNRLHGPDDELTTVRNFAVALSAHRGGTPVTPSRISRWETAQAAVGTADIVGYEQVLGISAGHLVTVADLVRRPASSPPAAPMCQVQELLERAIGGGYLHCTEWMKISAALTTPTHALMRRAEWQVLVNRLLVETSVARGWRYVPRFTALEHLGAHPEAARPIVESVDALLRDHYTQVLIDPVALLSRIPFTQASTVLYRHLTDPCGERVLHATLIGWGLRSASCRLSTDVRQRLADVAGAVLTDRTVSAATRSAAADLIAALRPLGGLTLAAPVRRQLDVEFRAMVATRSRVPEDTAGLVVGNLVNAVSSGLRVVHDEDPVLPHVLAAALFSSSVERKVNAGLLLAATPLKALVADALARTLGERTAMGTAVAEGMVDLLGVTGDHRHRGALETVLADPQTPDGVAARAAMSLGHLPGRTPSALWLSALDRCTASAVQRAVLYGAGMTADVDLLDIVAAAPERDSSVREGARWWRREELRDQVSMQLGEISRP
ncbi:hypothetical protein [Amycolatopsis sp. NPDC004625]|uniref:hypothetical protein n=1 Tax=Amycolatopsis sp. NPDC004625 TaxID=3154670 RepID=UPI0033B6A136